MGYHDKMRMIGTEQACLELGKRVKDLEEVLSQLYTIPIIAQHVVKKKHSLKALTPSAAANAITPC